MRSALRADGRRGGLQTDARASSGALHAPRLALGADDVQAQLASHVHAARARVLGLGEDRALAAHGLALGDLGADTRKPRGAPHPAGISPDDPLEVEPLGRQSRPRRSVGQLRAERACPFVERSRQCVILETTLGSRRCCARATTASASCLTGWCPLTIAGMTTRNCLSLPRNAKSRMGLRLEPRGEGG